MSTLTDPRFDPSRVIRASRGTELHCRNWLTEAAYRMIQNNLDPDVAENPQHLVVYGGIGRAARDWACYDKILETLRTLGTTAIVEFPPAGALTGIAKRELRGVATHAVKTPADLDGLSEL